MDKANEEVAIETVKRREPNSKDVRVTGIVRDFMQGNLIVVTRIDDNLGELEDIVFIREGQTSIYNSAEEMATALRTLTIKSSFFDLLKPSYVPGILALALFASWCFLVTTDHSDSIRFIENALGVVLGFYFGTRQ